MFGLAAGLYESYLAAQKISILVVGVDGAGKTALLERCKATRFDRGRQQYNNNNNNNAGPAGLPPPPPLLRSRSSDAVASSTASILTKDSDVREDSESEPLLESPSMADERSAMSQQASPPPPPPPPPTPATPAFSEKESNIRNSRRLFVCPSPATYSAEAMADADRDEEEYVVGEQSSSSNGGEAEWPTNEGESEEEANNEGQRTVDAVPLTTSGTHDALEVLRSDRNLEKDDKGRNDQNSSTYMDQKPVVEYDLKKGAKMFPIHKLRPTVGMNLGKLDACGCKCSFWDLGGAEKMRPLWKRYYSDADAIVFVVDASPTEDAKIKIVEARDAFFGMRNNESLQQDIPIMVFANKLDLASNGDNSNSFGGRAADTLINDIMELFEIPSLERYFHHENSYNDNYGGADDDDDDSLIVFSGGSAKTGEGVKNAFEWLISSAKTLQRERNEIVITKEAS